MIKNFASFVVVFVMIASPLAASAQTSSADANAVKIAQLQALILQLTQLIQQIITAQMSTPAPGATFTASPSSGTAPLYVQFHTNQKYGSIDYDTNTFLQSCYAGQGCDMSLGFGGWTYKEPGTYVASLKNSNGNIIKSTTITVASDWPSLSFSPFIKAGFQYDTWAEGLNIDGLVIAIKNDSQLSLTFIFPTNCWFTYKIYNRDTGKLVFDFSTLQECLKPGSTPGTTFTLKTGESKNIDFQHENRNFHLPVGRYTMKVDVHLKNTVREAVNFYFNVAQVEGSPTCSISANKRSYSLGEYATFTWNSRNATYAAFLPDTSGKDALNVPGDKLSASGSQQIKMTLLGSPSVTLGVYGLNDLNSTCKATVDVM